MHKQTTTEVARGNDDKYAPWFLLRRWWPSSLLDIGLPPFLEPGLRRWTEAEQLQRSLALCLWPGFLSSPMFLPYNSDSVHHQNVSKWRVFLDVAHFHPSEISLSITDGFLQIEGKHEEKADEHGFIARCFKRKYRLPDEVDASRISSRLSVDGFLSVEAPVSATCSPNAIVIPIKVEMDKNEDQKVKRDAGGEEVQPIGIELPTSKNEQAKEKQRLSEHRESKERPSTSIQAKDDGAEEVLLLGEEKGPESEELNQEQTK